MAGQVAWIDLTVDAAGEVRDFYEQVLGWHSEPVSMGEYNDYNMIPAGNDEPIAGVCHARGSNVGIPPVWMLYVTVENLEASIAACLASGGSLVKEPADGGKSCIIRDPAGAVLTLYQE